MICVISGFSEILINYSGAVNAEVFQICSMIFDNSEAIRSEKAVAPL